MSRIDDFRFGPFERTSSILAFYLSDQSFLSVHLLWSSAMARLETETQERCVSIVHAMQCVPCSRRY
jgi:hypothetical protein